MLIGVSTSSLWFYFTKNCLFSITIPITYYYDRLLLLWLLGLGTAGFPEAQQVQIECMTWLKAQIQDKEQETHDKEQSCE